MIYAWPPTGRISENYAQRDKAFSFLPKSKIVGKVGYALMPQQERRARRLLRADACRRTRRTRRRRYLFSQWATSPSISLQRVMLPYTLRDPYRISHYKSKQYRVALAGGQAVPEGAARRGEQRRARPDHDRRGGLRERARPGDDGDLRRQGHPDGAQRRRQGVGRASRTSWALTKQRASYAAFLKLPGATGQNTVAKQGPGSQDHRLTPERGDRRRDNGRGGGGHEPPPPGWTGTSAGCSSRRRWCSCLRLTIFPLGFSIWVSFVAVRLLVSATSTPGSGSTTSRRTGATRCGCTRSG